MKFKLPKKVMGHRIPKSLRSLSHGHHAKGARRAIGLLAAPIALGMGGLVFAISRTRNAEPTLE